MSMTLYDAAKMMQNPFGSALIEQVATSDELFYFLPFVPKAGEGFSYQREVSPGSFNFIAPGGAVANSTGTSETITVTKAEATEDFWIDNFAEDNQIAADGLMPSERQTLMKLKAAGRGIAQKVIVGTRIDGITIADFSVAAYVTALVAASPYIRDREEHGTIKYTHTGTLVQFRAPGDKDFGPAVTAASDGNYTLVSSSPSKWITVTLDVSGAAADQQEPIYFTSSTNAFPGLTEHVSSGQTRSSTGSNGDAISFEILDELIDSVKNVDNPVFIMHSSVLRKINTLTRALGAVEPPFVLEGTSGPGGRPRQVPSYNGIPILRNDWIPTNESKGSGTTLSSVYLANLGEDAGVYMGALGGQSLQVSADPRDATVLGFRMRDLGQHQSNSQMGKRLSWYGGLACGSDLSLAVAREIVTGL